MFRLSTDDQHGIETVECRQTLLRIDFDEMQFSDTPVAILAGGRATRLGPLASAAPKALIPVAGRPFVDHQLSLLTDRGLKHVVFCLGHLGDQIVAHVGDGQRFGMHVEYSFDGDQLVGTGGAIRRAADKLGDLCWVLYGDSYLDFDYAAAWRSFTERPEAALMTVFRNRGAWDQSNTEFANGRVIRHDKRHPDPAMEYIDYGAALLRRAAIDCLPEGPSDLSDLYTALAQHGMLAGFEVTQRFYEVGSVAGISDLEAHLNEVQRG